MKRIIFSLVAALAASVSSLFAQVREIPFGNMEKWLVRKVDESFIIGGKTRYLYEVAPGDTLKDNTPFVPESEGVTMGHFQRARRGQGRYQEQLHCFSGISRKRSCRPSGNPYREGEGNGTYQYLRTCHRNNISRGNR